MALEFRTWPDHQVVSELVDAIKSNALSLLTGSIVSSFGPTGLPDGSTLRNSILRALQLNDILLNPLHLAELNELALEQVLSEIRLTNCDDPLQRLSEQLGGTARQASGINPLHEAIADFQQRFRVPLFTTNFDVLHELAYSRLTGSRLSHVFIGIEQPVLRGALNALVDGFPVLAKLHGSLSDIGSMRATLNRIDKPLPESLSTLFLRSRETRHLLIMGYSGSDPDIAPLLLAPSLFKLYWVIRPGSALDPENCGLGAYGTQICREATGYALVANLPNLLEQLHIELCGPNTIASSLRGSKIAINHAESDAHWVQWGASQSLESRSSAVARLFIAVPHPSVALDILSRRPIGIASRVTRIESLILQYRAYALDDKHSKAITTCGECLTLLKEAGDEIGALECMREMAQQNRMLGGWRLLKARKAFKGVIEVCKNSAPAAKSSFFKIERDELLCEATLGLALVENQLTAYLPLGRRFVSRNRLKLIDEALYLQERIGGLDLCGNLLRHRALTLTFLRRFQEAESELLKAKRIFEGLGRIRTGVVNTLQGLSFLYITQFKLDLAEQVSLEALGLIPPEGALAGRAKHCRQLALIALHRGRVAECVGWLKQMRVAGRRLEGKWNWILFGFPVVLAVGQIGVQAVWGKMRKQLVRK